MSATLPRIDVPIERTVLASGATLLVSRREGTGPFALQVHMRGGHSLDPAGREGTAYLAGALIDQGTRRHGEEEIAALLEPSAGNVAGDASGLSGQIAARDWELLVELAAEMMTEPAYPRDEVELHRGRLLDRLLVERDDPRVRGEQLFRKLVYGSHWLGRPSYGSSTSVQRIQRADLVQFHRAHWRPERAIIAVCGDVDPRAVARKLEKLLRGWKRGAPLDLPTPRFPERAVRSGLHRAERAQVHVYLGHLGVARSHPDWARLAVMDHVLGTGPGFTNRIARKLRDEQGLAYTVNASIHSSAGVLPGTFCAYIGTSPEKVRTAVAGFLAEIRSMQEAAVLLEELETARSYLIGALALAFQRTSRRASFLISMERHKLPADVLERLPREYAEVTAADVQRVAREHLFPAACCLAVSGPLGPRDLAELAPAARAGGGRARAARR